MSDRDPLEAAFVAGAARALRRRATMLRSKAAPGVTVQDSIVTIASESAHALRIARDFEEIAAEIEREAGQ
jgi:hypothetical protein